MIQNAAFRRKVIYLGLMALLLIPLYVVGHPAVGDPFDSASLPGGRLAQLRAQYSLSPSQIGEIDPTSESMKLATLGMRGVAATILWSKANEYRTKENWEGLVATVNQMAMLQPNFTSVWEFQSHNLAYNVSAEQDDYRFRYLWVKRGLEFLVRGTHYNRRNPVLLHSVGWHLGQKVNRSDEHKQFRRLFKSDQDFHESQSRYVDIDSQGRGADGKPDSWLVSRLWHLKSYNVADTEGGQSLGGKTHHIFYADGPKALMNYVIAIEDEGILDERAEFAWKFAGDEWQRFGNRPFPTSRGLIIRLNDRESREVEHRKLAKELDELVPEAREAIRAEKIAKLNPEERNAMEVPMEEITDARLYGLRVGAFSKTNVTHVEVSDRAPANVRARAFRLAQQIDEGANYADWVRRYRNNVNFDYWRTRCQVEQLHDAVTARRHIYNASQLPSKGELDAARKEYELAWELWGKLIAEYPVLIDQFAEDDLLDHVVAYQDVLTKLDEKLPSNFPLKKLLEKHDRLPPELTTSATGAADRSSLEKLEQTSSDSKRTEPKEGGGPGESKPVESKPDGN